MIGMRSGYIYAFVLLHFLFWILKNVKGRQRSISLMGDGPLLLVMSSPVRLQRLWLSRRWSSSRMLLGNNCSHWLNSTCLRMDCSILSLHWLKPLLMMGHDLLRNFIKCSWWTSQSWWQGNKLLQKCSVEYLNCGNRKSSQGHFCE